MIKSIIKVVFRFFLKYKVYFLTNIIGLAIGFASFIMISLFINYEYNWDKHNVNYDRIFRVNRKFVKSGDETSEHNYAKLANMLEGKFPEIEEVVLFFDDDVNGEFMTTDKVNNIKAEHGIYADQNFLKVFSYNFIKGAKNSVLVEPNSVVLSQSMTQMLFQDEDPMGKTITLEKKYSLKVTGVYEDLPDNSSIRPEYIITLSSMEETKNRPGFREWWSGDYRVYVMLYKGSDESIVNKKIENLYAGYNYYENEHLYLLPLSMQYLKPNKTNDYLIAILLYGLMGIFALLLSSINYINLTTANASIRWKEVAVKKSQGSSKMMLIFQFLAESVILSFLAVCIALLLTETLLPVFNNVINRELELSYRDDILFIIKVILIGMAVGLMSGIYPAFVIASRKTSELFKGDLFTKKYGKIGTKKVLVAFQLCLTTILIITSLTFMLQIKYMHNKDYGFKKENILFTMFNSTRQEGDFNDLRLRILNYPEIIDGCIAEGIPFISCGGNNVNWEGSPPDVTLAIRDLKVSPNYFETLGMTIVRGQDFSDESNGGEGTYCIINETAWKKFGWEDPIGKRINDNKWVVKGIVKDFHYRNMHEKIEPFVGTLKSGSVTGDWGFAFRVAPNKINEARKILTDEFEAYFPNDPFQFLLLEDEYKKDDVFLVYEIVNNTILFFTAINILLAIIGLFGLVSFTVKRRTKEIAIRKINGSSRWSIFYLLSKEYLVLWVISVVFIWPFSIYAYQFMPGNNKCGFKMWELFVSSAIVLVIILITSIYKTISAAKRNPVEALRYE